jgi:hypothetical protein
MKTLHPAITNTNPILNSEISIRKQVAPIVQHSNKYKQQIAFESATRKISKPILLPTLENTYHKIPEKAKPMLILPSFECLICCQSFSNMVLHDLHVRTQHKPEPQMSTNKNSQVLQEVTNITNSARTALDQGSTVEGFKCVFDNKVFAHRGFYETHMKTVHTTQNKAKTFDSHTAKTLIPAPTKSWPFQCGKCLMGFPNQILVAEHVKTFHLAVSAMKSKTSFTTGFPDNLFNLPSSSAYVPSHSNKDDSNLINMNFDDPMAILQRGLDELTQTLKSSLKPVIEDPLKDNHIQKKAKKINNENWSYLRDTNDSSFADLKVKKSKEIIVIDL